MIPLPTHRLILSFTILILSQAGMSGLAQDPDQVISAIDTHSTSDPEGRNAFTFDRSDFETSGEERAALPIGVFDSGIGGLTVLEALLTADHFDNETLKPGPDGEPDFKNERFIYLGDQANMPYGNYSREGKSDYLRELILKDATFLLGNRYRSSPTSEPSFDKPSVKAIVIACNTATAFGLEDMREVMKRWNLSVPVIGVVEAGARALLEDEEKSEEAIGVLATVGTCASEVYPRTIQSTLGRAGRGVATVTQFGSADLAAVIEGDASGANTLEEQIMGDVRALVETHREETKGGPPSPLGTVMLGCTHFPLVQSEIDAAFTALRSDPELAPWIAESRTLVDPASWTARQLFQELARNQIRSPSTSRLTTKYDAFYLSVPNPNSTDAILSPDGGLDYDYKYGRSPGNPGIEDTVVIPMTRAALNESGRRLVRDKLPETWSRIPMGEPEDLDTPPPVTAQAWAIADAESGELLWHHDAFTRFKTASTTKTMSALVVLSLAKEDPGVLDELVTFSAAADKTGGSTSNIAAGEKVTVRDGLYGLMLPSGNDMGNALAEHFNSRLDPPTSEMIAKGLDNPIHRKRVNFLAEMNRLGKRIGLSNTFYRIAYGDGGPAGEKTSCAADLCIVGREAMANDLLREVVGTRRHVGTITIPDGNRREQAWENTNELLHLDLGYDGIKTGYTRTAGHCLLASGERDGRRLLVVVLGSASVRARWTDTRNLFRWAWKNLEHGN